jgi:hypothetical protein
MKKFFSSSIGSAMGLDGVGYHHHVKIVGINLFIKFMQF